MDHEQVGQYWNENAEAWTRLSRSGCDLYRDHLNTPAFLENLPDIAGKQGIDIGCGEGHNTRLLARRGAVMSAVDIAAVFIGHAKAAQADDMPPIDYRIASAVKLPFPDGRFDFATAFMSLMDVPETDLVLAEAYRVIRPGGFLQFSITHPCFDTPHRRNLRNEKRVTYAIEVGDYFRNLEGEISEWIFGDAPPEVAAGLRPFRIPRFTRTISQWINLLVRTGFVIEHLAEPRPSDGAVRIHPGLQDAQVVAYFLHVRVRKPGG